MCFFSANKMSTIQKSPYSTQPGGILTTWDGLMILQIGMLKVHDFEGIPFP